MIDGYGVIRELSEHRFNSLSVHHNYRELGPEKKLSMQYWKEAALTPEWLDAHGLLYAPGWFQKADGGPSSARCSIIRGTITAISWSCGG